jgi:Na+-transporting NADH:ubiquinone oxidoreductase subunit B
LGAREIALLNLDLLALTFLSFGYALRSELRVEDSGQVLLTLDGPPTSPADYAHGQRCSSKTEETPVNKALTIDEYSTRLAFASLRMRSGGPVQGEIAQEVKKGRLPKNLFLMQPMMIRVCYGLIPCLVGSVYYFGLRSLVLTALVLVFGIAAEGAFTLRQGKPISSAVFVSCLILALSLPPTTPFWIAIIGIVFGVVFGKMVFGGFGYNVFNPAMVGRCFIYIAFPVALTARWVEPFSGTHGGFAAWSPPVDALTGATPLVLLKAGKSYPVGKLFLGNIPGSLGETAAWAILLGGIYIVATKAAQWRLVLSCLLGGILASFALWSAGIRGVPDPLTSLMAGSFLFGAFFVVTEPVSGPKTKVAQWIYGFLIGGLTIVIRKFSSFSAGIMFATLLMNIFVSVMDLAVNEVKGRSKKG